MGEDGNPGAGGGDERPPFLVRSGDEHPLEAERVPHALHAFESGAVGENGPHPSGLSRNRRGARRRQLGDAHPLGELCKKYPFGLVRKAAHGRDGGQGQSEGILFGALPPGAPRAAAEPVRPRKGVQVLGG